MLPLITNHFYDYGTICILMAISVIILIVAASYRARAIKNKAKDRQIALKAVADIEPELKGRDVEKMKITNSIFDNDVDSIYIEYEQGLFVKPSNAALVAIVCYQEKYRRVDLLFEIAVCIFASLLLLYCVSWLLFLTAG